MFYSLYKHYINKTNIDRCYITLQRTKGTQNILYIHYRQTIAVKLLGFNPIIVNNIFLYSGLDLLGKYKFSQNSGCSFNFEVC